jgi:hypothetical protein
MIMRRSIVSALSATLLMSLAALSPATAGVLGPGGIFVNEDVPTRPTQRVDRFFKYTNVTGGGVLRPPDPETIDTSGAAGTFYNNFFSPGNNPSGAPILPNVPPVNGGIAVNFPTGTTGMPVSTPTNAYHPGFTICSGTNGVCDGLAPPLGPLVETAGLVDTQVTFSGSPTPVDYPEIAIQLSTNNNGGTIEFLNYFVTATAGGLMTDTHYEFPVDVGAPLDVTLFNLDPAFSSITLSNVRFYISSIQVPLAMMNDLDQPLTLYTTQDPHYPDGTTLPVMSAVPEPSSATLLSIGALGALVLCWRRRSRRCSAVTSPP